ncbi:MAG: prepilin-type N-terminal cleavage/methylation domain-containing protein [Kiritimatiellae bacterium]|nr:prepilin-type N-terminal cleavage/methylation domain-containing protein [Kiritimatiellia bacterium]
MKKGFTILELLVASLLLGMLVTILTMIFNQSSIAWRTGTAVVEDLGDVRECIAAVREEADDLYIWNNDTLKLLSPWNEEGELRTRAISADTESDDKPTYLTGLTKTTLPNALTQKGVGGSRGSSGGKNYIVNVKCAGPDREFDTWDDIWSYPDDFE